MEFGDQLIHFDRANDRTPAVVYFVKMEGDVCGCRRSKPQARAARVTVSCRPETLLPYQPETFQALKEWRERQKSSVDSKTTAAITAAIEHKQHLEYLCFMMLDSLVRLVPLRLLVEHAVEKGWCSEDVLAEFFDVAVTFTLNGSGMTNTNPGIAGKQVGEGVWSFTMFSADFERWLALHNLEVQAGSIVGDDDGYQYGNAASYETPGCSSAGQYTIEGLLAAWRQATDQMLHLVRVG